MTLGTVGMDREPAAAASSWVPMMVEYDDDTRPPADPATLEEASRLLVEAFDLLADVMPATMAGAIACQVIEDLALAAGRGSGAIN